MTTARAMRATRQRAAVSGLLDRVADFRSAQEIHEELRRVGEGIGLTTVYRTLQALADGAFELDMVQNIGAAKSGDWQRVEQDVRAVVDAAGDTVVKVILETAFLTDDEIAEIERQIEREQEGI